MTFTIQSLNGHKILSVTLVIALFRSLFDNALEGGAASPLTLAVNGTTDGFRTKPKLRSIVGIFLVTRRIASSALLPLILILHL